jgi:gamma-glutamyltranspeptidase
MKAIIVLVIVLAIVLGWNINRVYELIEINHSLSYQLEYEKRQSDKADELKSKLIEKDKQIKDAKDQLGKLQDQIFSPTNEWHWRWVTNVVGYYEHQ